MERWQRAARVVLVLAVAVAVASAVGAAATGAWEAALRFTVVAGIVLLVRAGGVPRPFGAGFAVLLLLATWASVRHWYRDLWQFDVLVHVLTPGALAAAVYFVLVHRSLLPGPEDGSAGGRLHRLAPVLWVALVGTTAAVVWEVYEVVVESIAPSVMHVGYVDTIVDLVAGLLGSTVAGWLVVRWSERHHDASGTARPVEGATS